MIKAANLSQHMLDLFVSIHNQVEATSNTGKLKDKQYNENF